MVIKFTTLRSESTNGSISNHLINFWVSSSTECLFFGANRRSDKHHMKTHTKRENPTIEEDELSKNKKPTNEQPRVQLN